MSEQKLSTFEKCKAIRNSLLTRVGESMSYTNWSDKFKLENIQEIKNTILHWEKTYGSFDINPNDLSMDEMKELGFSKWDEDSELMLIPIWLYKFLADEFECQSINGTKYNKLSEIDNDHRFGCLAYGVIPSNAL